MGPDQQVDPLAQIMALMQGNGESPEDAAAKQALFAALHGQVQQAQQGAEQAGQQYQDAANAPPPQNNPFADLIGRLAPQTASIVSGNPEYAKQGHQDLQDQHTELMQRRVQTLKSLADQYSQKADAAEKLGNLEAQQKFKELEDKAMREQMKLLVGMKGSIQERIATGHDDTSITNTNTRTGSAETIGAGHDAAGIERARIVAAASAQRTAAAARAAGSMPDGGTAYLENRTITSESGRKWFDATGMSVKDRQAADRYAGNFVDPETGQKGMPVMNKEQSEKLRTVQSARMDVQSAFDNIQALLPEDAMDRLKQAPGIKFAEVFQTNPILGSYGAWRSAAIKALQGIAGGAGSGLRINQAEITMSIANDIPKNTDTWASAQQKLQNIRTMLDNGEMPYMQRDWRPNQTGRFRAPNGEVFYRPLADKKKYMDSGAKLEAVK